MKTKVDWYMVVTLLLGVLILASGIEQSECYAVIAALTILYIGILIGKRMKKIEIRNSSQAVKFENLKAGFYEVSMGFFESLHCAQTGCCTDKFIVLERQEKQILIEVNIAQRLGIEKVLVEIRRGTSFKIDKKSQIEKV